MATTTAPKQRSETAEQILDLAEMLIQTRGYSAFSYQDISDSLGIRKASIHYHFASKTDLGIAVVDRYIARFDAALTDQLDGAGIDARDVGIGIAGHILHGDADARTGGRGHAAVLPVRPAWPGASASCRSPNTIGEPP